MTRASPLFSGVAVPLLTIFQNSGEVDGPATARLAERLVEAGVRAVVVGDIWGEGPALTQDERVSLLQCVRRAVPASAGVPVIASAGAPSAREARRLAHAAVEYGADAILAYSPPLRSDAAGYYREVEKAAAGLPLIAAHQPEVSWPGIEVSDLADLPVAGFDDASGDPERLLETLLVFDGEVYTGSSAVLALAGPAGASGAIVGLANAEPERCAAAFGGDGPAQLELARDHVAIHADFPERLKVLAAKRFGMSTATRMG